MGEAEIEVSDRVQVRDSRRPGWLWVRNEVFELIGSKVGVYGIAAYCALARHVDNQSQECYVSLDRLTEVCGCSRPMVIRAIKALERLGLLSVERKPPDCNVYTLLEWPGEAELSTSFTTQKDYSKPCLQSTVNGVYCDCKQGLPELDSPNKTPSNKTEEEDYGRKRPKPRPLTEGMKYCLHKFSRKRFSTTGQRDTLEALEKEVGTQTFKRAVDWLANFSGLDANKLVSCARKMAQGDRPGRRSEPQGEKEPRRYIEGRYAEYIEH